MRARLLLLLVFAVTHAKEVVVKDANELRAAVGAAMPGDVIKLAKGRYNDVSLRLTRGGTESRPITLAAAEPGEVIFAGASEVELAAPYLVLDGLYFLGGALAAGAAVAADMTHLNALAAAEVNGALKKAQKRVILLWLAGGASQLETWDPKPGATTGGPFKSIQTSVPGTRISELLPLPETPLTQMNVPSGKTTSTFLRLLPRAPMSLSIRPFCGLRRCGGVGTPISPLRYLPVNDFG